VELADVLSGRGGFAIGSSAELGAAFESAAGAGDIGGDGHADVIVGIPRFSSPNAVGLGESHVIFGKSDGGRVELPDVRSGRGGFSIRGSEPGGSAGYAVAGTGDVDGDGVPDLLVGAPFRGGYSPGESYVVFGKSSGASVELSSVRSGQGGFAMRGASTGDRSGASVSGAGDMNGDGLADLVIGARYANPAYRSAAGESYVVFGKPDGASIEFADVRENRGGFSIRGSASGDFSFSSLSDAGDVNGDGLADFILGAPYAPGGGRYQAGVSYVVFGTAGGKDVALDAIRQGRGGFEIRGAAEYDYSGTSVAGAGDIDGDGLADVLVGAPGADAGAGDDSGVSYVVFGKEDGAAVELSEVLAGRGGFSIRGRAAYDYTGSSVAGAGDVNGDGLADIHIGAPYAVGSVQAGYAGESYVVFGKQSAGPVDLEDVAAGQGGFGIQGAEDGDEAGASVAGAGDVNGDGLADVIVGAPGADRGDEYDAGESYIVFGKQSGATVRLANVRNGTGGFAARGVAAGDYSGKSVAGAGDVDGDGLADLVIGAPYASPRGIYYAGESYVVFGKEDGGAVLLSSVQAGRGGFVIRGGAEYDYSGTSVAGVGDIDGDGLADVLIGTPGADPGGRLDAGESHVILGKKDGAAVDAASVRAGRGGFVIAGNAPGDYSGRIVSRAGDLNGDGMQDLLVAARLPQSRYPSLAPLGSGAVYVILGGGGASSEPRFLRGDCDADGRVGITDAVCALDWLFRGGSPPGCIAVANSDGTGEVGITDPIYLLTHLFLGGTAPPAPYPECGTSAIESDRALGCERPPESCAR
jgi:hypothetical protein